MIKNENRRENLSGFFIFYRFCFVVLKFKGSFKRMKFSTNSIFCFALSVFLLACSDPKELMPSENNLSVAKIEEEQLSKREYEALFQSAYSGSDSAELSKRIIETWAGNTLVYLEALKSLSEEEVVINKQVEEYRQRLLSHIYLGKIVEANLDTTISDAEILQYYTVHHDNFVLKENIVKVDYIKVPLLAPELEKIKKLVRSNQAEDRQLLIELCIGSAENFFLNDSTWLYTSDIRKEIPKLVEEPDFALHKGKVAFFEDENYMYYLRIKDVKIKNGLSPLNFERANIKQYILLNRKTVLLNSFQQNLLDEAKSSKKLMLMKPQ